MKVELISVGTEILMGNIVNTNAAYLAEQCAKIGLVCFYQSVVGDNEERLLEAIKTAVSRSDVVILSGGLGPTEDDLTKETAAKVMGRKLVPDAKQRQDISDYFAKLGREIPESNWKQALVPEGAKVLYNPNGTAPGPIISEGEKHVILLPGPPSEMKPMFEDQVAPFLKEIVPDCLYSKTIKVCGIGESKVAAILSDLIKSQTNPTIATYAKPGEVHLRVTAKASEEEEAKKLVKPIVKEIKNRLGASIYTTREDVTLEQDIVELLTANNLTVCTAESCTGGMVSARIINVPGASEVFKYGFVTYSNKAKRKLIGVK
ncbi:MAG: competence/damage-inducible protein A, partial [Lachnospiraceae bacterium]|nr:competence/damage-inducible protein A [Lachnospiraceae bacterium]